ncbi:MAG TPA: AAA-like domain-containing protein [Blastocatellia bacterium]|nr:AAA-like domain-containing protein [Blastocatellia bacterium]
MNAIRMQQESSFYVTGGTLSRDALCYVTRQADADLHSALDRGEFCYVLTARQMGKSSLMVRTASHLRDEGVGVVVLDLTAIGQNLTAEQWYGGLLTQMANQLCLEDELEAFWDTRSSLGPLHRWMHAVRQVVLPSRPGRVVVFIDEIDAVRSLPFSTDEFFAAIREFYNRRSDDLELERLTFCLLGVASPSDLIRDTRMTPFNIGRRLELHDFTEEEAQVLAYGLAAGGETGASLLGRILYWTNGHPYLTQRLCRAVAEQEVGSLEGVDHLCDEIFFARRAREQDDNLLFVRERMLRGEVELAALLSLYEQVCGGKRVEDDETNSCVTALKLSGVTRIEDGRLRVRNRIYERVFDQGWVAQNMPDAEVRRQRAAYRKGLWRAASIAAVVLVSIASISFVAMRQRNRAAAEARHAEEEERTSRRLLYGAQMNLAARDWQDSSIEHMRDLLAQNVPRAGQTDLRGFEWYLMWALAHPERKTLRVDGNFRYVIFSPDFNMFASSEEADIKLWDMTSNTLLRSFKAEGLLNIAEFSKDGRLMAAEGPGHSIVIRDITADRELKRLKGHSGEITDIKFSPDGSVLATASADRTARLWQIETGNLVATLKGHKQGLQSVYFSPDGRQVATAAEDRAVKLWEAATGLELMTLPEHPTFRQSNTGGYAYRVLFSPDGRRILATGLFMNIAVWDAATGKALPALEGHDYYVTAVAFSPDGKLMATGSDDRTILLWDVDTWRVIKKLRGHGNRMRELAFSPDGETLASAAQDATVKLWDVKGDQNPVERAGAQLVAYSSDGRRLVSTYRTTVKLWDPATWDVINTFDARAAITFMASSPDASTVVLAGNDNMTSVYDVSTGRERFVLKGIAGRDTPVAFSSDGKLLATGSDDKTLRLWNAETGEELARLTQGETYIREVGFSPDGKLLASAGTDASIKLWDVATRRLLGALIGHTSAVAAVAFSPDSKVLASASGDSTIRLWDVETRRELSTLKGHAGAVHAAAFSPDGKRLVTSGHDFTVRLWDVTTGEELATFRRHTAPVWSVAFSPDGKTLVSAGRDGILRIWRAATEEEVHARETQ